MIWTSLLTAAIKRRRRYQSQRPRSNSPSRISIFQSRAPQFESLEDRRLLATVASNSPRPRISPAFLLSLKPNIGPSCAS